MFILFGLIIISLTVASGFLIAFLWAVKNGQFEDDYTPSVRMLFDDEPATENPPDGEATKEIKPVSEKINAANHSVKQK